MKTMLVEQQSAFMPHTATIPFLYTPISRGSRLQEEEVLGA